MKPTMGKLFASALAFGTLAFGVVSGANTCVWTGEAGDGKWSTPGNWQDNVAPVDGGNDRLVFNASGPLVVENDLENFRAGYVETRNASGDASASVTITGKGFSLGDGAYNGETRIECWCATTFDVPLVFAVNLKANFCAAADFKFNHDITLNGTGTTRLGGGMTGDDSKIIPNVYFYGGIYGTNAQIDAVNEANNGQQYYYHYGPVVLQQYDAGMEYRNNYCYFYATGNDVKTLRVVGYGRAYLEAANAFAADNALVQVSTRYSPSIGGQAHMDADQTFANLTVDSSLGSKRTQIRGSKTLTLTAGENLDLPFWHINSSASFRWAPTADCSVTLSCATNDTTGSVYVDRGTLKIGDEVRFEKLSRLDLAANTGLEIAAGSENCFGASPKVVVRMRSSAVITLETNVKVKSMYVDGVALPAGEYGVAKGTPWISGAGTLTVVDEVAGNYWTADGDGDWNAAANWAKSVPTTETPTFVTKYGNRTVSVDSAPASAVGAFTMDNLDGKTVLDVNAPLAFDGGAVALGEGAQVNVNEGGEWNQTFNTAAASDSETFSLRGGAKFVVDGGVVNLTDTRGRISVGGADGTPGTLEIKSGTVTVKHKSGNGIYLNANGLLKMTGGLFAYDSGASFCQYGGTVDLSGDALVESSATGFYDVFKTGTLRISGNAQFKDLRIAQNRWFFTPNNAGEVCRIELDGNGFLDVHNDAIRLNNGKNAAKTIVTARGNSRFDTANGVYVGIGAGAEGEIDVYDQAYVAQEGYGYGMDFGSDGNAENPAKGILRMHGGAVSILRSPNTATSLQGAIFGKAINTTSSRPIALGVFEMTGGALTNKTNAVVAFGAGMAEGTGTQSGGLFYHQTSKPVFFGFRGGKGEYGMSGGSFLSLGDVYVGGAQTNDVGFFLKDLADRPAIGRLSVSGGEFDARKSLFVSAGGYGTLEIVGTNGVVKVGADLCLTNSPDAVKSVVAPAKLKFVASADGCGKVKVANALRVAADAELEIDLSAYEGKRSFRLVECASVEGAFAPENVTVSPAAVASKWSVVADANGYSLRRVYGTTLIVR